MQNRQLRNSLAAYLAIAVFSIGVFGINVMHHESFMQDMQPANALVTCRGVDCGVPVDGSACINHCINAVQNFTQSFPVKTGVKLSLLLASASFAGLSFVLTFLNNLKFFRSRLRQLYEQSVLAFSFQLGFWLTLFEKRDPSPAFVIA